jgi:hypothetical protein
MNGFKHKLSPAQEIFTAILTQTKGDPWNIWRKHYDKLSITDLIWLNTAIDSLFPKQAYFTLDRIKEAFVEFFRTEAGLSVIELGCHQGHLAKTLFETFNISHWEGYDVSYSAIDRSVIDNRRYRAVKMTKWFHEISIPSYYNVFVSSHTLEHLSFNQVEKTIEAVLRAGITYMMIEIPFKLNGAPEWKDAHGSHVLYSTRQNFEDMIQSYGFSKIYYNTDNRGWSHIYGWKYASESDNYDYKGPKS